MLLNDKTKTEERIKEILIAEVGQEDKISLLLQLIMHSVIEYKQRQGGQMQPPVKPANDDNWHICKYCGGYTNKPDNDCYKNPNWKQETVGR